MTRSRAGDRLPFEEPLGARPVPGGVEFRVWAPWAQAVAVRLGEREAPLEPADTGVWEAIVAAAPGDDYRYVLRDDDGEHRAWPDPCSRFQPEGVRGPSRVVDPSAFAWSDDGWRGIPPDEAVIYELHVGTFTPEGTFDAAAARLADLAAIGVTVVEVMPVATFPGDRNWGYDGLYNWAPHPAYGGPAGLARLVDAAHAAGIAVILDVVYNHVGPGNEALTAFGPYFSERHGTPWGQAVNFDGPDSGAVREWAIQNACMWVSEYHLDGLRLDAVHAIVDTGPRPVLRELTERVRAAAPGRELILIAESDANDPALVRAPDRGGMGFDGVWSDDLHHALFALLTGDRHSYYADYGAVEDLAAAFRTPFTFDGRWSPFRRRRHGAPADDPRPGGYVVCAQNHDQVGNRALGDRPAGQAGRLGTFLVLLSPWTPLLFMGEEYAETRPFMFFTDHIDPEIARATREGRRHEHAHEMPEEQVPDPQDPATFTGSVLDPAAGDPAMRALVATLIRLRRELPPGPADEAVADEGARTLRVRRGATEIVASFAGDPRRVPVSGSTIAAETGGAGLEDGVLHLPPFAGAVVR